MMLHSADFEDEDYYRDVVTAELKVSLISVQIPLE